MDLFVYDDADQRYVPVGTALLGLLLVALLAGCAVFLTTRSESVEPLSGVTPPQAAMPDDTSCETTLAQADAALELGKRIEGALSQQTALVDDLLAQRASAEQVLAQALPELTEGAKDRQAFLEATAAYQIERATCSR